MHDGMPYGRIQGQGQGHSREVDRQSPTELIFYMLHSRKKIVCRGYILLWYTIVSVSLLDDVEMAKHINTFVFFIGLWL